MRTGSDPSQLTGDENDASVRGCGSLWRKRPSLTELTGNRDAKPGKAASKHGEALCTCFGAATKTGKFSEVRKETI